MRSRWSHWSNCRVGLIQYNCRAGGYWSIGTIEFSQYVLIAELGARRVSETIELSQYGLIVEAGVGIVSEIHRTMEIVEHEAG